MVTIAPIPENDLELVSRQLRRREFENELLGYRAILAGGASPTLAPISAAEAEDLMCLRDDDGKPVHNPDGIAAWQFDFSGSQHLSVLHALAPESDAHKISLAHIKAV